MATKRLNINLPIKTYEELRVLADDSGRSMTEIVRASLGLAKLAYEEGKKDRVLVVAGKDGKIVKELLIL